MYLYFFPPENFLRDFPVNNRPICNILPRPETEALAELLGKHYGIDVVSPSSPGKSYSFFLGPLSRAPSSLLNKLPDQIKDLSPRSFVSLIPDISNPSVWIGGKSVSDFLQTVKFLNNVLPYLLQNYLIAGDFHLHTTISDGKTEPEEVCYFAAHAGLDAIAVTDHNNVDGAKKVRKCSPERFPVVIGEELTDKKGNHLLVFGIKRNILKGITPKILIDKWRFSNLLIVQAHPTDQTYFMIEGNRAMGVEAFNFLSSAPQKGRDYAEESLKKGCKIAILGCSDAHLPEDIGKAKTYLMVSRLNSDSILQAIRKGETVAFYRGNFCGKETLQELLLNLYLHSNLLSGKLVPLSEMDHYGFPYLRRKKKSSFLIKRKHGTWYQVSLPFKSGVVKVETTRMVEGYLDGELVIFGNRGGLFPFSCYHQKPGQLSLRVKETKEIPISLTPAKSWAVLKPENHPPLQRIFCPSQHCQCQERWFRLDQHSPFLLDFGSKRLGQIKVNSIADEFLFYPRMEMDLKPFLCLGKNKINISDEEIIKEFNPRLCLGKELKNWEIKKGKSSWRKVECASNLQVLGIAPKNYVGEITYRTVLNRANFPGNNPTLFFEGVDGEVDIRINGLSLMRRGAYHWEDAFEIPLNSFSDCTDSLEITLHIVNEGGLCGLTNWVHLGENIYLKYPLTTININENQQEIQLLRCGEGRVRAFLCDSSLKVVRYCLAGSSFGPFLVDQNDTDWLVLNSFNSSIPLYQPKIASLITSDSRRIKFC